MTRVLALVLSLPCVYWTQGPETAPAIKEAGLEQLCMPPDEAATWRGLGFQVTPLSERDLKARTPVPPPGIVAREGLASPTRSPWIEVNGWQYMRDPEGAFLLEPPAGVAVLAAAEAFAYGANVVMKVDPSDLSDLGKLLAFLAQIPPADLPDVADFGVVDDGSPQMGEVLKLLVRRNLLFERVRQPAPRFPFTVRLGAKEFSRVSAADPSAFALRLRRRLGDEHRSLRIYGSEVVVARLTGDAGRARLHLLNYSRRGIEGLRIRLGGSYPAGDAYVAGLGRQALADQVVAEGATEFSLPSLTTYAVVDLTAAR